MARKNEKTKDTKLLQVYVELELHSALGHDTKNAPVVRVLLPRFLEEQGYYNKRGEE